MRLHGLVDRPNLLGEDPGDRARAGRHRGVHRRGCSINVTLIFSLERYAQVIEAYLRGLERLVAAGGDSTVASVASFFVSRVDTEMDRRLDEIGAPSDLQGKLAIANAKLAYQRYQELFPGARWDALAAEGREAAALPVGVDLDEEPGLPDVFYVEELIGSDTVNTMPLETIEAFQDHGDVADTLEQGIDEARRSFEEVAAAGVDYDDVVGDARARGRREVLRVLRAAARRHRREARRARRDLDHPSARRRTGDVRDAAAGSSGPARLGGEAERERGRGWSRHRPLRVADLEEADLAEVDVGERVADERVEAGLVDLHVEDGAAAGRDERPSGRRSGTASVAVDPARSKIVPTTWKFVSSVGPAATT